MTPTQERTIAGMHKRGMSAAVISRVTGLSRHAVARALTRINGYRPEREAPVAFKHRGVKERVRGWLAHFARMHGTLDRIEAELRSIEHGGR